MNTDATIAFQDPSEAIGAIVWWSLIGDTDILDMEETLTGDGFDDSWMPSPPRVETIVKRAAEAMATDPRQLIRALETRGQWEFVTERVDVNKDGEHLEFISNARISVTRDADNKPTISVIAATQHDKELAVSIQDRFQYTSSVMNTVDMSNWLLRAIGRVSAVSLRDRGGFYFVPQGDCLNMWRKMTVVVEAVSGHQMNSMPVMASGDATKSILHAVQRESAAQCDDLEEYMAGELSTRGLNSGVRKMRDLQTKVGQYAEMLGVEQHDLIVRADTLLTAIRDAQLLRSADPAPATEVA